MRNLVQYIVFRIAFLMGVLYLFAFCVRPSKADDYMSGMVGISNSGKDSLSETKFLNYGHREPLGFGLSQQFEIGGWIDRAHSGRKNSGYAAYEIGVEAKSSITARVMFGPALITTPDAYLGGPINFTEDFFLGISGDNGNMVGMKYKHISSGGIYQPNVGRDFLGPEVSISF